MSEPRRGWSLRSKILLGLAVLLGVGVALIGIPWYRTAARVSAELAALKAQGLPTTAAEVNDFYRVPEGVTDTTELWLAANTAVKSANLNSLGADLPIVGNGPTPIPPPGASWPELEASRALVESLSGPFAAIRRAAAAGGQVRFPVDFSAGLTADLTNTQDCRSLARLLLLDAHVAAHDGDHARALEDVKGVFSLSHAIKDEPTLISSLVRIALYAIACDAVEQLTPYCNWSDAQLASLQEAIRRAEPNRDMAHALAGERAIGLSSLDTLPLGPFRNSNALAMLDLYRDSIAGFNSAWPGPLEKQRDFGDRMRALASGRITRLSHMGVLMLAPAMEKAAIAAARCEARRRCTLLGLATQRYRLKHGQFPASLDEVTTAFSGPVERIDPFDGKPLRARIAAGAFVIYSIGENERDDGGQLTRDKQDQMPDVGFALK